MSKTNPTDTHITEAPPTTAVPPKMGNRRRLGRMITGIALAAAAIALTTGVTAASAEDPNYSVINYPLYNVYISSVPTGMLLDVQYGSQSPGAPVIQWPLDYGANQLWDFQPDYAASDSAFGYIINVNSGQCLSTDGVLGHAVFQLPCQGADWQRWWIVAPTGGQYHIASRYNKDDNLDVYQGSDSPGTVIDLWGYVPPIEANQLFTLLPGPPA